MEFEPIINLEQRRVPGEYPKAMILDMDGTLNVNPEFYRRIYSGTLEQTIYDLRGQEGIDILERYRQEFDGRGEVALEYLGIPYSEWAIRLNQASLDDVVPNRELVERLRIIPSKKIIFTGSPREFTERLLTKIGFNPNEDFDGIVAWDYEKEPIPRKWGQTSEVYQEICDRFGLQPSEVWAIGDNWETDLLPAQQLGMTTIQINKSSGNSDFYFPTVLGMINEVENQRRRLRFTDNTNIAKPFIGL